MRPASIAVVVLLLVAGCADDAGPAAPTTTTTTTGAVSSSSPSTVDPGPPATVVLLDALPSPIAVEGESLEYEDRHHDDYVPRRTFELDLPDDFYGGRQDLLVCVWTDEQGWAPCSSAGLSAGYPAVGEVLDLYVLLHSTEDVGHPVPLRRLLRVPRTEIAPNYQLADGYASLVDVLSMVPPDGGNYLVPVR